MKKDEKEIVSSKNNIIRKKQIHFSVNPNKFLLFFSYVYQLFWLTMRLRKKSYIAVIANAEVVQNSLIIILCRILGVKTIPISYAEEITGPLYNKTIKSKLKKILLKCAYPKANKHISCCHFAKELLTNKVMVPNDNIKVVPVSYNKEKMISTIVRNNKKNNTYNILSVGRLVKRKGFAELIDVVKELKVEMPLINLNIVGHGPLELMLKQKVINENLEDYIIINGRLSDKKLSELYKNSDLFILAHRMLDNGDTEGSPITFAEAGFYGLPSIGGINSGASTIIDNNQTGLIIDMKNKELIKDSIRKLFKDRNLMQSMGKAAQKKILFEHTPKKIGKSFEMVLNDL